MSVLQRIHIYLYSHSLIHAQGQPLEAPHSTSMPIKQAAKKYVRVTAKKTLRNKIATGVVKSAIKKTREAVAGGNVSVAQEWLKKAGKALDKAAQKKIIKKNTAARKKSRLNALVKKIAKK